MSGFVTYKTPKILFIKGVFAENCKQMDELLEERLLDEEDAQEETLKPIFTGLPQLYYGMDKWVTNCNIKCHNCGKFFTTVPKFVPRFVDKGVDGNMIAGTEGCFDKWPCVIKYIELRYPRISKRQEKIQMVLLLYQNMEGREISYIPSIPHDKNKSSNQFG